MGRRCVNVVSTKTELENFVYNIKWLRRQYGLSRKQMADILEIGIWSIGKLEKGEMPPRLGINVFFAVQKYFGISPAAQLSRRLGE